MDYKKLGNTSLDVSVAGLGCGGNSRVGLGRGASQQECVDIVRTAIDLGVNFLDTAEGYGTEEIVGEAASHYDRTKLVISTKAIFRAADMNAEAVERKVDESLARLRMDYVDVFHFHAVNPKAYTQTRDILAPALQRAKEAGKVRHIGITETGPNDPAQEMLQQAVTEPPWEVVMLAYSLINQGARHSIFPTTIERGVGTSLMFVVRNIFSRPDNRRQVIAQLVADGALPPSFDGAGDPLEFLVSEGGAASITDAAYRFARHEAGADVILFGSGNKDHIKQNIDSILNPPLAPEFVDRLRDTFGHLVGVGLDLPDHMQK